MCLARGNMDDDRCDPACFSWLYCFCRCCSVNMGRQIAFSIAKRKYGVWKSKKWYIHTYSDMSGRLRKAL
jgi:hypothetical protein